MKMGIERVLKENYPYLKSVEAVTPAAAAVVSEALITEDIITAALVPVASAIQSMGGSASVLRIDGSAGRVVIGFKGPARLKQGIQLILKDVKHVTSVEFEDL